MQCPTGTGAGPLTAQDIHQLLRQSNTTQDYTATAEHGRAAGNRSAGCRGCRGTGKSLDGSPPLPAPWREHHASGGAAVRLPLPCRQRRMAESPSCALASGVLLTLMLAAAPKGDFPLFSLTAARPRASCLASEHRTASPSKQGSAQSSPQSRHSHAVRRPLRILVMLELQRIQNVFHIHLAHPAARQSIPFPYR